MFIPLGDNVERREIPIVTILLIAANVFAFAYQMRILLSGPDGWEAEYEFVTTWGLVPNQFFGGDVSGLLTHMFLHGDLMHLLGNMIVLWAFACTLEEAWGTATFGGFYLLFGLIAGVAHAATNWGSEIPMVGASGAIAGLMGAYAWSFGAKSKIRTLIYFFRAFVVEIPASYYCIVWFVLQVWAGSAPGEGADGVAWWAHIGGFLAGGAVVGLCRNEFDQTLTQTPDGELKFERVSQVEEPEVDESELGGPLPIPFECPYCSGALSDSNRLADNLARCKNPDCERLVMLELATV